MSTITVCYRNNFRLGSSKKYAVLSFKDEGIKIICTDEYPENFDTLVLALNYRNQCIYLPSVVMDAYGLGKSIYNVEVLDENRFFIRKPKLYDLTFEKPTADKEERTYSLIQKYRTKRINEYKMSVSRKENISMSYKVDMYFGERNYAKITSVPIIPDGANTIDDIKDIYGANLLMYPYNSISYYVDQSNFILAKSNNHAITILFPTIFLRKWDIANGQGLVEVRNIKEGIIISPIAQKCEITGEIIEPADNPVKNIRTCEDHVDELEEIKSMVDLIRGISEMCQIVKNNNEQLRGRVEKLEAALF